MSDGFWAKIKLRMTERQKHMRFVYTLFFALMIFLSVFFTSSCSDSHTEAIGTAEAGSASEDQIFKAEISKEGPPPVTSSG